MLKTPVDVQVRGQPAEKEAKSQRRIEKLKSKQSNTCHSSHVHVCNSNVVCYFVCMYAYHVYYKTQLHSRPLAKVAPQRDVVALSSGDATVYRLGPGHVGKYREQVLQFHWREGRVLILVRNKQRNHR